MGKRTRSDPYSDSVERPWDVFTDADRARVKRDAAASVLYDLDDDRTDPAWLRYCARHDLDPAEA